MKDSELGQLWNVEKFWQNISQDLRLDRTQRWSQSLCDQLSAVLRSGDLSRKLSPRY